MAQSYKVEKKLMDEKIAKVREVVRSVKNDDIILALHNNDLDVERTIQAFCEVGAKGALGEWEHTKVTSKKNKKKNKPQENGTPSSTPSSQTPIPNGAGKLPSNNYSFSSASDLVTEATNGYTNGYLENHGKPTGKKPTPAPPTSSSAAKPKPPVASDQNGTSSALNSVLNKGEDEQKKAISRELSGLQGHHKELDQAHNKFDKEIALAQSNLTQCFQELRQALMERERHLHDELMRCRQDGDSYFNNRRNEIRRLQQQSDRVAALKDAELRHLVDELQHFQARRAYDTEVGHATRFVYDNSKLIRAITGFGEVVPVKGGQVAEATTVHAPPTADIKHSTSHSSLVSSVGEDSGLGQVSPVAQNKNQVAQVETVASNTLSTDELADIHRRMEEILKNQGIDTSVLSSITSSTTAPRRRPPPKRDSQKSTGSGDGPKPKGGNPKKNQPKVELSILK